MRRICWRSVRVKSSQRAEAEEEAASRISNVTYTTRYNAFYRAGDKPNPGLVAYHLQLPRNGN